MNSNTKFSVALVALVMLFNINSASAQLRFGLKGGFDVNNNRLNKDILNAHNRLGFQVGGTMEFMAPIVGWGGELSVLYGHQKGDGGVSDKDGSSTRYSISDYNYLRVPLNLKKKFSVVGLFGVFVQAGPYVEFKLSGGDVDRIDSQWKSKSFGAGVNAGAGVELLSHLELGMYYRKSLTNNYSDEQGWLNIVKKRPHNWSVDLTYFF